MFQNQPEWGWDGGERKPKDRHAENKGGAGRAETTPPLMPEETRRGTKAGEQL